MPKNTNDSKASVAAKAYEVAADSGFLIVAFDILVYRLTDITRPCSAAGAVIVSRPFASLLIL